VVAANPDNNFNLSAINSGHRFVFLKVINISAHKFQTYNNLFFFFFLIEYNAVQNNTTFITELLYNKINKSRKVNYIWVLGIVIYCMRHA